MSAPDYQAGMAILSAIRQRRSVRAFRPDPVQRAVIEDILEVAARAPSGSNIQPWKVTVVTGRALAELGAELTALSLSGDGGAENYPYYPRQWREPYQSRRRQIGGALYNSLGIERGDKAGMARQLARNYSFFGAPVGLFLTIDRDMEVGSWLDMGMFAQSIMIAARAYGLDTCPQQAFCYYHRQIAEKLGIPDDQQLIMGMSLGYADAEAPENRFDTDREPVEGFARFVE